MMNFGNNKTWGLQNRFYVSDLQIAAVLAVLFLFCLYFLHSNTPVPMPLLLLMGIIGAIKWPIPTMGFLAIQRDFTGFIHALLLNRDAELSGKGYFLVEFIPIFIAIYRAYPEISWNKINKITLKITVIWILFSIYGLVSLSWSPVSKTIYAKDPLSILINVFITLPLYFIGLSSIERFYKFSWGIIIHVLLTDFLFVIAYIIPGFRNLLYDRGSLVGEQVHRSMIPLLISIPLMYILLKKPLQKAFSIIGLNIITLIRIFFDSGRLAFIVLFLSQILVMRLPISITGSIFAGLSYTILSSTKLFTERWQKYRILGILNPEYRDYGWEYRAMTNKMFFERWDEVPIITGYGAYSFGQTGWYGDFRGAATMHNGILEIYWDLGLIGSLLLLYVFWIALQTAKKLFTMGESENKSLAKVCFAIGISLIVMTWVTGTGVRGQPFLGGMWMALWADPKSYRIKTPKNLHENRNKSKLFP